MRKLLLASLLAASLTANAQPTVAEFLAGPTTTAQQAAPVAPTVPAEGPWNQYQAQTAKDAFDRLPDAPIAPPTSPTYAQAFPEEKTTVGSILLATGGVLLLLAILVLANPLFWILLVVVWAVRQFTSKPKTPADWDQEKVDHLRR